MLGFFFLAGIGIIYASQTGWKLRILFIPLGSTALLVLGVLAILFALWGLRQAFRPDPVTIDATGLGLRGAGINRVVPWGAIDAVFLEPHVNAGDNSSTHRLVVTPAPGVELGTAADYRNQADGRPSIVLLAVDEIQESVTGVHQALATFAGPRVRAGDGQPGAWPVNLSRHLRAARSRCSAAVASPLVVQGVVEDGLQQQALIHGDEDPGDRLRVDPRRQAGAGEQVGGVPGGPVDARADQVADRLRADRLGPHLQRQPQGVAPGRVGEAAQEAANATDGSSRRRRSRCSCRSVTMAVIMSSLPVKYR